MTSTQSGCEHIFYRSGIAQGYKQDNVYLKHSTSHVFGAVKQTPDAEAGVSLIHTEADGETPVVGGTGERLERSWSKAKDLTLQWTRSAP